METNEVIEQDWEKCEYCECSYYEHDTGYSEYECNLYDKAPCVGGCIEYGCPLSFKYKVKYEKEK